MPAVSVQFALILEAYCRGSVPHIEVLKKQVGHIPVRSIYCFTGVLLIFDLVAVGMHSVWVTWALGMAGIVYIRAESLALWEERCELSSHNVC